MKKLLLLLFIIIIIIIIRLNSYRYFILGKYMEIFNFLVCK